MGRLNEKRLREENNFLAISKDWEKIADRILNNETLLKLVYYTSPDALSKPNLTTEQKLTLINKNIISHPYIPEDDDTQNYIQVLFGAFEPNSTNPEYIDNAIIITLMCHKSNWTMENWQLRLYRMANEIMNIINNKKFSGIGTAKFIAASPLVPSNSLFGLTMTFGVINSLNEPD